jgi:hypothetical protein
MALGRQVSETQARRKDQLTALYYSHGGTGQTVLSHE